MRVLSVTRIWKPLQALAAQRSRSRFTRRKGTSGSSYGQGACRRRSGVCLIRKVITTGHVNDTVVADDLICGEVQCLPTAPITPMPRAGSQAARDQAAADAAGQQAPARPAAKAGKAQQPDCPPPGRRRDDVCDAEAAHGVIRYGVSSRPTPSAHRCNHVQHVPLGHAHVHLTGGELR